MTAVLIIGLVFFVVVAGVALEACRRLVNQSEVFIDQRDETRNELAKCRRREGFLAFEVAKAAGLMRERDSIVDPADDEDHDVRWKAFRLKQLESGKYTTASLGSLSVTRPDDIDEWVNEAE